MNHSQYLFSCLLKLFDADFNELEYDIQFDMLFDIYEKYEKSEFNIEELPEYECMINFLKNKHENSITTI
jgi:hypothetical protein